MNSPKNTGENETLIKLAAYCAYQERCHKEVLAKLADLGVFGSTAAAILLRLIEDNYVNEERFAKAFAGGKFRVKQWGKQKIIRELKIRDISEYCIQQGLREIEDEDYFKTLKELVQDKYDKVKFTNALQRKYKTAQYAITRGFESNLVWDILSTLSY